MTLNHLQNDPKNTKTWKEIHKLCIFLNNLIECFVFSVVMVSHFFDYLSDKLLTFLDLIVPSYKKKLNNHL